MRKVFGLLIMLVAVFCLGMAYTQFARAEGPDCASDLAHKMVELAKKDDGKILELQYTLTALKLARETLGAKSKTVETYIKQQTDVIANLEKLLENKDTRETLVKLYQKYGKRTDQEKIEAKLPQDDKIATDLDGSVNKMKNANYFKVSEDGTLADLRLRNRDLSAYVLAHTIAKSPSPYDENDVAILWYQAQISEGVEAKMGRGSKEANLTEMSTRVAQITGIAGTTAKTPDEIDGEIKTTETAMTTEMDRIIVLYKDELSISCKEMATCAACGVNTGKNRVTDEHRQTALKNALQEISMALPSEANTSKAKVAAAGHLPEVVVTGKSRKSTDDLILKLKGPAVPPTGPLDFSVDGTSTTTDSKVYSPAYRNCLVHYTITPVAGGQRVRFEVYGHNFVSACRSSYVVSGPFTAKAAWKEDQVKAECDKSANVNIERACQEAPAK